MDNGQPSPSPAPRGESSRPPRVSQQKSRQRSVIYYIAILFMAAFFLLLLSYLMERRQNMEHIDSLNQSLSDLKGSVSAMQTVQDLYDENAILRDQVNDLENRIAELEREQEQLQTTLDSAAQAQDSLEKTAQAMDWFWQINEAFVRGRYSQCRTLIQSLKDAGLEESLPQQSITDNGRFSPRDRLEEICNAVL